jgi:hypothetical protein
MREFSDADGREWRAWEIKPEAIHPATKSEDYLADCYITGWIVFETVSGDEKRRLCPWPINWMLSSDARLRDLLASAEVVVTQRRGGQRSSGPVAARERVEQSEGVSSDDLDITDLHVVRTFKYPGGRYWTVGVVFNPEDAGPPALRFASGLRSIDLRSWPKDWADRPDEALVEMLRSAAPRRISGPTGPGIPRRRWDDQADASP